MTACVTAATAGSVCFKSAANHYDYCSMLLLLRQLLCQLFSMRTLSSDHQQQTRFSAYRRPTPAVRFTSLYINDVDSSTVRETDLRHDRSNRRLIACSHFRRLDRQTDRQTRSWKSKRHSTGGAVMALSSSSTKTTFTTLIS